MTSQDSRIGGFRFFFSSQKDQLAIIHRQDALQIIPEPGCKAEAHTLECTHRKLRKNASEGKRNGFTLATFAVLKAIIAQQQGLPGPMISPLGKENPTHVSRDPQNRIYLLKMCIYSYMLKLQSKYPPPSIIEMFFPLLKTGF